MLAQIRKMLAQIRKMLAQIRKMLAQIRKINKISRQIGQWELECSMQRNRRTDKHGTAHSCFSQMYR